MSSLRQRQYGFTIVELLIVIVVIAILAAISIVAYNGVQQRAKNAQTVSATEKWIKILKLYYVDRGVYPTVSSCFGSSTTYPNNKCDAAVGVDAGFIADVSSYTSNYPEPDNTNISTDTFARRGSFFTPSGNKVYVTILGPSTTQCPSIAGYAATVSNSALNGGIRCVINLDP